jgi:hypothetical protein
MGGKRVKKGRKEGQKYVGNTARVGGRSVVLDHGENGGNRGERGRRGANGGQNTTGKRLGSVAVGESARIGGESGRSAPKTNGNKDKGKGKGNGRGKGEGARGNAMWWGGIHGTTGETARSVAHTLWHVRGSRWHRTETDREQEGGREARGTRGSGLAKPGRGAGAPGEDTHEEVASGVQITTIELESAAGLCPERGTGERGSSGRKQRVVTIQGGIPRTGPTRGPGDRRRLVRDPPRLDAHMNRTGHAHDRYKMTAAPGFSGPGDGRRGTRRTS